MEEKHFAILRRHMIEVIGIYVELAGDKLGKPTLDQRVLTAMGRVPRHAFVPSPLAAHGYQDAALPIGFDKTISQPFIIAVMTDLLEPRQDDVVLEVGTGLGYQAAVPASSFGGSGALRSSRSSPSRLRPVCAGWATTTSTSTSATAPSAGRRRALRQDHRLGGGQAGASGPAWSSSSPAAGWCCLSPWPRIRS